MKTTSQSLLSFEATCNDRPANRHIAAAGLLLGLLTISGTGFAALAPNPRSTIPIDPGSSTTPNQPGTTNLPPPKTPSAPTGAVATTDANGMQFSTELSGYEEVHFSGGGGIKGAPSEAMLRGAISTTATGKFAATLNPTGDIIDYELSYSGLESDVTQGHIHFGQRGSVGGIVVWLCQTAANPAPEPVRDEKITPLCPGARDGTVKGTITPEQVLEVSGQGIAAKEFDELVRALQSGTGYANVHSQTFPQGEIRGQIGLIDVTLPTGTSPTPPGGTSPMRR